jgi:chromosome segregation ATPase
MVTDTKQTRGYRRRMIYPVTVAGVMLFGAVAGHYGPKLIRTLFPNPQARERPGVAELTDTLAYVDVGQHSDQSKASINEFYEYGDAGSQSGLTELRSQYRSLYSKMDSLGRELTSYRKGAGINSGQFRQDQDVLRTLQSDLGKLQRRVENNDKRIQDMTDPHQRQDSVTLNQVKDLIRNGPKLSDSKIKDVVERTLRNDGLTDQVTSKTMHQTTVNSLQRKVSSLEREVDSLKREMAGLERRVK